MTIQDFADAINELMPEIIKGFMRRQRNELFQGKITLPQFLLLDFLHKHPESKMTDVAYFLNITTAAATGIVERLVRNRFIERISDVADRRVIKLRLTLKGQELLSRISQQRRRMIIEVFSQISEKERQEYLRTLKRIRDILASKNPKGKS